MELKFRQRADRPDAQGRCAVVADVHWAGGHRWKTPTGVKCTQEHWQPAKTKRVNTSADDANGANLRLTRFVSAVAAVFLAAEVAGLPETSVTQQDLAAAVLGAGSGSKRKSRGAAAPPAAPADEGLTIHSPWGQFEQSWQAENGHLLAAGTLRLYKQVVTSLKEFDTRLRLAGLTKEKLAKYVGWLYAKGKRDSTVQRHYSFLRECHNLAGLAVPKWLGRLPVRYGRSLALRRNEAQLLLDAKLPADLAEERDVFLFQMLLLLRDVDLRALRPHHVSQHDLSGHGAIWCADLYQEKTGEPVRVPLPAPAAVIWERWAGRLPIPTQQERNRRLKALGRALGWDREFVENSFSGKVRHEQVMPVWQAVTTHTARHTGAALLIWASEGDQTLKEIALGHVSASVYGYDTLERYGPKLLSAWATALG